jgi:hypothetical protein
MTQDEFDKIMACKGVSDAKSSLALESKDYQKLADACYTIGNTLQKIGNILEKDAEFMDKIAVKGVTINNASICSEVSKTANTFRYELEEAIRFNSYDSHEYFNDLESALDKLNEVAVYMNAQDYNI